MVKTTFGALIVLCVVCVLLFGATTLTNGGQVYKTFATHPDTPPSGALLLWAKNDGTFQVTNNGGTDSGMGGGGGGGGGPIVSAYSSATLPTGTLGTWNIVPWDSHAFDTSAGAMHSTTTNNTRFVAATTGYYYGHCSLIMSGANTFFVKLTHTLAAGGTSDVQGSGNGINQGGSPNNSSVASAFISMSAGDYVECAYDPPLSGDTPANGTTWTGANFQFVKMF